jgi:hypothetical protein
MPQVCQFGYGRRERIWMKVEASGGPFSFYEDFTKTAGALNIE